MEVIAAAGLMRKDRLASIMKEADELLSITVASINTARRNAGPLGKTASRARQSTIYSLQSTIE
jgi:hypothetical protein